MTFEGKFWLLWEQEPIDIERGRVVDLRNGVIIDGRTWEPCGTYDAAVDGIEMRLDEDVVRLKPMPGAEPEPPFDPADDTFLLGYASEPDSWGFALRNGPHIAEMDVQNRRDAAAA